MKTYEFTAFIRVEAGTRHQAALKAAAILEILRRESRVDSAVVATALREVK